MRLELRHPGMRRQPVDVGVAQAADQRMGSQLMVDDRGVAAGGHWLPNLSGRPARTLLAVTDANPATAPVYEEHAGPHRQYLRDIMLGVNDGLVSMFLLVAGVVGGGLDAEQVLLTGIAGALAGAISMATGEYLATKSQDEVFAAEMALERTHLRDHRDIEREELRDMLHDLGVPEGRVGEVVDIIDSSDDAMLGIMGALEFGVVDSERRSPYFAAIASGFLFLGGSAPSVLPFFFVSDTALGLAIAGILSGIGLFAVGAVKTMLTKKNPLVSGLENLAIGVVGGALSFAVGRLFGVAVS
ncbi:MAG: hypothetical protein EHM57_08195 [Actinobacteria bacterium]|nr:MAG: hypothetical protein EHM57_08195 [Actinomycetota bacterium]